MKIPIFLTFLGSYLGVSYGIYRLFEKAGDVVNEDTKTELANRLTNLSKNRAIEWPEQFTQLFDSVFTTKHLSFKCFRRSIFVSICVFFIINLIYLSAFFVSNDLNVLFIETKMELNKGTGLYIDFAFLKLKYLIPAITLAFLLNAVGDYISLLTTRLFIEICKKVKPFFYRFLILIADFIVTALIFLFLFAISSFLYIFILSNYVPFIEIGGNEMMFPGKVNRGDAFYAVIEVVKIHLTDFTKLDFFSGGYPLKIFFVTTFFTSFWLWGYLWAGFLIRIINLSKSGISFFTNYLDIEKKPFRSLGFVLVVITTLIYAIWGILIIVLSYAN